MRKRVLFFVVAAFFVTTIFFVGCSKSSDDSLHKIGIVTATNLVCREYPSSSAKAIKQYSFGTPVELNGRSEKKEKIDGLEDYWYRDSETGGWLFGGFLIITEFKKDKIGHFKSEMIRCNVICGGFSCFFQFSPFIINEYYIARIYLYDYPEGDEPEDAVIIGRCSFENKKVTFFNAEKVLAYDASGKVFRDIMKRDFDTRYFFAEDFSYIYKKHKDEEGEFYSHADSSPIESRPMLREKCSKPEYQDEIWVEVNVFEKLSPADIRKIFFTSGFSGIN